MGKLEILARLGVTIVLLVPLFLTIFAWRKALKCRHCKVGGTDILSSFTIKEFLAPKRRVHYICASMYGADKDEVIV